MTREEATELIKEIHAAYPSWRLDDPTGTIDFWHRKFEHESFELVRRAFYEYVDNEERSYAPQVGQIKKIVDKIKGSSFSGCTMIFDRDYNLVHWTPEPGGQTFDIVVWWDDKRKCYVDEDGQEYIDPTVDYSEKIAKSDEKLKVQKHNEEVAKQLELSTIPLQPHEEHTWMYEIYE